jgi:hypothetical protein
MQAAAQAIDSRRASELLDAWITRSAALRDAALAPS